MAAFKARAFAAVLACALSAGCAARANLQSALPQQHDGRSDDNGHRSYVLPLVEIVAMDAAINRVGRVLLEPATFDVTPHSIRRNLRGPWVVDDDPFQINQIGHPYQGAMYHGIARSNGLGYWPSVIYTFAGSAVWEIAGETTQASFNDQVASGIAGSFLGESLFRISRLLLDRADEKPGVWRTLGSVLLSPPTGINQALVGTPAGVPMPDAVPFSDIRVQVGATSVVDGRLQSSSLQLTQPHLALSMDYGYPGNAAHRHERPFDYFRIEANISSDGVEQVSTRGLIAGADYGADRLAGVWGLYGTYDYFTPDDFRLSTTAFSFGTTLQGSISESLVVQTSGLLGGGYAAVRTLGGHVDNPLLGQAQRRDYHYGIAPQALVNLRVISGRRAALDLTAREYFISALGGFDNGQRDFIFVGDASFAVRVAGRHALGVTYQLAGRTTEYLALPDEAQSRSRVGVFYTFLGSGGFGTLR